MLVTFWFQPVLRYRGIRSDLIFYRNAINSRNLDVGIAVTADLDLVFDTVSSSRKYGNLKSCRKIASAIGWSDEITLQYEGEAEEPAGSELKHCKRVFFAKWPDGESGKNSRASHISGGSPLRYATATSIVLSRTPNCGFCAVRRR